MFIDKMYFEWTLTEHSDCFLCECLAHFIPNDASHCPAVEFLGRHEGERIPELSELVPCSTVMFSVKKETNIRDRVSATSSTRHLDKVTQLHVGNRTAPDQKLQLGLVRTNCNKSSLSS